MQVTSMKDIIDMVGNKGVTVQSVALNIFRSLEKSGLSFCAYMTKDDMFEATAYRSEDLVRYWELETEATLSTLKDILAFESEVVNATSSLYTVSFDAVHILEDSYYVVIERWYSK